MSPCECGCGQEVNNRFARGHHARLPEYKAKLAAARSAEHPAAKRDRNALIARLYARGWSGSALGRRFGISRQRVDQIVKPLQDAARKAVTAAVERGDLIRPGNCDECGGDGPIESHHDDYDRPLDVRWLCVPCHKATHQGQSRRLQTRRRVVLTCPVCGAERRKRPSAAAVQKGFCSRQCARHAQGSTYSRADLLAYLQDLAQKVGHTPRQKDINDDPGGPCHRTFYDRFASLREAQHLAGLTPNGNFVPASPLPDRDEQEAA